MKFGFEFKLVGKNGETKKHEFLLEKNDAESEAFRKNCVTIYLGQKKCNIGLGFINFIEMSEKEDYVIDNTILIKCILVLK